MMVCKNWLAGLAILPLMACSDSADLAALKVVVSSNYAGLEQVRVRLFDGHGDPIEESSFRIADHGLPFSFTVVAPDDPEQPTERLITLDAERSDASSAFVRTARFDARTFPGQTMYLFLDEACASMQCATGQTCTELGCVDEYVSQNSMRSTSEGDELGGLCEPGPSWCTSDGLSVESCNVFGESTEVVNCAPEEVCTGSPSRCEPSTHNPNPTQPQLTVRVKGGGEGAIIIDSQSLRCEGECTYAFNDAEQVNLRVEAGSDSYFVGWGIACGGSSWDCWIMMQGDMEIEAQFERNGTVITHEVWIQPEGAGSGRVYTDDGALDCPDLSCSASVNHGTNLVAHAVPDASSVFVGWQGVCYGIRDPTCSFPVEWDADLRPVFQPIPTGPARFDLNSDGFADAIYGAPGYMGGSQARGGRVYVRFGPMGYGAWYAADSDRQWDGPEQGAQLGRALSAASDITGDGHTDLVIGAPGVLGKTGAVYAIAGGPGLIGSQSLVAHPMVVYGAEPGARFGSALTTRADVDGDGQMDLIVGAPGDHMVPGRVFVYLTGDFSGTSSPVPSVVIMGEQMGDQFGASVQSAGDLDGDGRDEFIVGAPRYDAGTVRNAGRAYVFKFDTQLGLATDAEMIVEGNQRNDMVGFAVTGLGDWQGDATQEWAVATHVSDKVYVFSGFQTMNLVPLSQAPWILSGPGFFGSALGGFEDYNGDGRPDLVVGAPIAGEGQVSLFAGGGPTSSPAMRIEGSCVQDDFCGQEGLGYTVGPMGDLDLDGVVELGIGSRAGGHHFGPQEIGRIVVFKGNDPSRGPTERSGYAHWEVGGEHEAGGLCAAVSDGAAYVAESLTPEP